MPLVGLALLIVGIASAVLLILDVVLGRWPAVVGCTIVTLTGLVAWYGVPMRQRIRGDS